MSLPLPPQKFTALLLHWYAKHKRSLPWRQTKDPYKIWISEIILQQTRVAQGLSYYERFVAQYPTLRDLAVADLQEVMRLWQGLGYYSRVRNLHACARWVCDAMNGHFPTTYAALRTLKGVGPYTAAAIASFAFGEAVAVVDGNVYRVLSRVFDIRAEVGSSTGNRHFENAAQQLLPEEHADTYNQAIMEFGALQCTPKPQCASCPLQMCCAAYQQGSVLELPVKRRPPSRKRRFFHYLVLMSQGKDFLYMRPRASSRDIWHGLYDFYLVETSQNVGFSDLCVDPMFAAAAACGLLERSIHTTHRHILTHQELQLNFTAVYVTAAFIRAAAQLMEAAALQAYDISQVDQLPKPMAIEKFLKAHFYV